MSVVLPRIAVQETAGLSRPGEMVRVGTPCAAGALPARVVPALRSSTGEILPCQSKILKTWPDGSAKWLLLDFAASVDAGSVAEYEVVTPAQVPQVEDAIGVVEDNDRIVVETGKAVFSVTTDTFRPFSSVLVAEEEVLRGGGSKASLRLDGGEEAEPTVESVTVEECGPLRAVLFFAGRFTGSSKCLPRFRCRLYFAAGSSAVRMEFTIHNDRAARHGGGLWDLGSPGSLLVRSLQFAVPCGQAAEAVSCMATPSSTPIVSSSSSTLRIYQESSGGENWRSSVHRNRDAQVPMRHRGYIVDEEEAQRGEGLRATPILWCGADLGVAIAVPRFWQEFPCELSFADGAITFSPFPARFPDLQELQGGEEKTFEWSMDFSAERDGLAWALQPLFAHATPGTFSESGVLGDLPGRDDLVDLFVKPTDLIEKREVADEYGWRNFGEIYADHEAVYHQGPETFVSHYNNQYDFVAGLYRKFFATGDAGWRELAAELARHVRDIDLYHTSEDREEFNHGLFWHTDHYVDAGTATHRSFSKAHLQSKPFHLCGGGPGAEHCYTTGLMLHYFQTGNPDFRDAVVSLARWELLALSGPQTVLAALKRGVGYLNSWRSGKGSGRLFPQYPLTRGTGNAITACLDAFEVGGGREFLERAEDLVRNTLHPEDDIAARDLLDAEVAWSYTVLLAAVVKFLDKKKELAEIDNGFAYARASLLSYAQWMAANEYPYLDKPEILEYPNETWAAQDIRKSVIFYGAARYAWSEDQRARFQQQAKRYYAYARDELQRHKSSTFSRPIVLMLQNGWVGSRLGEIPKDAVTDGGAIHGAPTPKISLPAVVRRTISGLMCGLRATSLTREVAWLKARLMD